MKKKDIQNLLNMSLDKKTPKLTKKILSAPINTSDNALPAKTRKSVSENVKNAAAASRKKNIFTWVSLVACVLVVVVVASVCGVYFTNLSKQPVVTLETTCYEVDINPSVLITADKEGNIIHIAAQNEDADVVLSSQAFADYGEMSAQECIETFIYESARLGYIDCTSKDNKVSITVISGEKSSKRNRLAQQTAANIQQYLKEIDIYGVVSATVSTVKNFVNGKGWQYAGDNLQNYLQDIQSEYIYYRANNLEGGTLDDIRAQIEEFETRLESINALLNTLSQLNDQITEETGKSYWDCKVTGIFGDSFSDKAQNLIAQADQTKAQLESYGITVSSIITLEAYLIKYDIIEEVRGLVEEIKDGFADSFVMDMILHYVNLVDGELYATIKNELATFYNEVVAVLNDIYKERVREYGFVFESRPEISEGEYDEFLSSFN